MSRSPPARAGASGRLHLFVRSRVQGLPRPLLRNRVFLGCVGAVLLGTTCTDSTGPTQPRATSIQAASTTSQQAVAGNQVPDPPAVIVRDQSNNPMAGVSVTFVAAGGGTVTPGARSTGSDGIARLTSWTLDATPGTNTVTASLAGAGSVIFTADGVAPLVATSAEAVTPVEQQATVGTAVAEPPGVLVRDQNGAAMAGVSVTFVITSGSGSVALSAYAPDSSEGSHATAPDSSEGSHTTAPDSAAGELADLTTVAQATGADGIARLANWTLGAEAGANVVTATVQGLAPVTFTATGTAVETPPTTVPTVLEAVTPTHQEQVLVNTAVPAPPGVVVRDQDSSAMAGVVVTFAVVDGAGTITPTELPTGTDGIARLDSWTVGPGAGLNTIRASVSGLPPVNFTAAAVAPPSVLPASVVAVTTTHQNGQAGAAVAVLPGVLVRDKDLNPLGNVAVTFAVAAGGGSIAPTSVTTGANGEAHLASWTLGSTPGANTVTASVTGVAGAIVFSATGATPATIEAVTPVTQDAPANSPVPVPPGVLVRSQGGIPLQGIVIAFTVIGGGGSVSPSLVVTGADGVARLERWSLGNQPGPNVLTAGLAVPVAGVEPVTFAGDGTGAPAVATTIEQISSVPQLAPMNAAVPNPPGVIVRDQNGHPLDGITVTFAVTGGGGAIVPTTVVSSAGGIAQSTSWTLGGTPGTNTVTATVAGLPLVTFLATALGPATLQPATPTAQQAVVGTAVSAPPGVFVLDQQTNPVAGISVSFAVTDGGGAIAPAAVVTGPDGFAGLTSWTVGPNPGTNTVTATVSGLTQVTFTATGVTPPAAVPASIEAFTPLNQQGAAGAAVPVAPGVIVRDQNNSPLTGVSVAFSVTSGGGAVTPPTVITDGDGRAQLSSWTLGSSPGNNTVTAAVSGLQPVVFSANGVLVPAAVQEVSATSQSAIVGTPVSDPPGVIVRDQNGAPIQSVTVAFAVTAGGGTRTPASAITGADGIARLTSWTLGPSAGANTLTVTVSGLVPVTFSATGTPQPAPTTIVAITDTLQQAPANTPVPQPPGVLVRDQNGDPIQGVSVAFAVTLGNGSVAPTAVLTNAQGIAQTTTWTIGSQPDHAVTATVAGLPPVTFRATRTPDALRATTIEAVTALSQQASAGIAVADPPGVRVRDQNNALMPGVSVAFAVTAGGGAVAPTTVTTGTDGIARLTSWTLGIAAGANTVTATVGVLEPVVFTATGTPVAASVQAATATSQQAPAGSPVSAPPGVIVRDQNNDPISGVSVVFAVTAGNGSIVPATVITGANGVAQLTSWTLGTAAGTNTITATVTGLPSVTFNATGTLLPASVQASTPTTQQAAAGSAVSVPPGVLVRDQNNNPMAGVSVAFAVTSGGGSIAPATVATGANGVAQLTTWTLGPAAGANTVTATVTGLPSVTFTATGALVAASVQPSTPTSQQAAAGSTVPIAPGVLVRDQNNNPLPGVTVTFAVTGGGGSATPASVVTNASGIAQLTSWTLGPSAGPNTLTATVTGLPLVTFTATALAPAAMQAVTPTSQTAPAGGPVSTPPGVIVRDQNNNPLPGVTVAFAVTGGGGSIVPGSVVSGADGIARLTSWTLGAAPGANTVTATVSGLPVVTFTATGSTVPTVVQAITAVNQQAPIGTAVAQAPGVIVRDQNSNPLAGVTVNFAVTAGGGTRTPASVVTGPGGTAQLLNWTLGPAAGTNTLTATVSGLPPVTFSAIGLAPTAIQATTPTSQTAPAGGSVPAPPAVVVRDQFNNPLPGVTVTFAVISGGGFHTPATAITGGDGIARVVNWTLGSSPGSNSLRATVSGLGPVTFNATGIVVPTLLQPFTPTNQEARTGTAVPIAPGVTVRDQNNNPMSGVTVTFAVTSGGGTRTPSTVVSNTSGNAQLTSWTLGPAAGANTLSASVVGLPPVTFTATGILVPTAIQATTVIDQSAAAGAAVAQPPAVLVRDQNSNPLPGATVNFAITGGGGSVTPTARMTGPDGIAQVTSWTLGAAPGANAIAATVVGLPAVNFTATGTLAATVVAAQTATSQIAPAGTAAPELPRVIVRDQNNNPIAGVTVDFAVTAGGGSRTPASVVTGAGGTAQVTSWTLGTAPATNMLTATVAGLASVTFTVVGIGPTTVQTFTLANQQARVGTAVLQPPGVIVRDQNNNPVAGVTVTFAVTGGGGTRTPASVVTNASGAAQLTSWTLGPNAGTNTLTATVSGLPPVTFSATGLAPSTVVAFTPQTQEAPAGSQAPQPPAVVVRDQNGNTLAGVTVTFAVTGGGGSLGQTSATTGSSGLASASSWVLGAAPGANTVTATVVGLPTITFSATGLAPPSPPATITAFTATSQEAAAGTAVLEAPGVVVRNGGGEPVPGVTVAFSVTGGGGLVNPATVVTDSAGLAQVLGWRLGTSPGANTLTAAVSGLAPVTFAATGTGSGPIATTLQAITSTNQQAPAGSPVSSPPGVLLRDQNFNAMVGVNVTFQVTGGGGSVTPSVVATNASGAAFATTWTLGATAGTNTVTATAAGLAPITFTATATLAPASVQATTATTQQGPAGGSPPQLPAVVVRDQNNNPLVGVNVSFSVTAGGGSVTPLSAMTAANGVAQLSSWTLGFTPGTNSVSATVSGLPPVTFTATGVLAATTIQAVTSTSQQGAAGSVVAEPPGVIVRDQSNTPMAGVNVTFAVASGGGSVTPAVRTTGADGIARLTTWTLGSSPGANSVTATVGGLPPVTFSATGILVPTVVQAVSAISQHLSVGADVADPPAVRVRDQNNSPMQNVNVAFTVTGGGGSSTPAAQLTGPDGIARLTRWTVGATPGLNTLNATATGLAPVAFSATAFTPASIQPISVTTQNAPVGAAVLQPPQVLVRDQNNNPLYGVNVTFAVTSGGGSIVPAVVKTGATGVAQLVSWTLGATQGTNTVAATAPGLPAVTFTATGLVAPCPDPSAISVGATVNGTLGSTGCRLTSGEFVEFYSFTVGQATTVRITQSSTALDSYVLLLRSTGKPVGENDDAAVGTLNSEMFAFLLPGTYIVGASSFSVGEAGPFSLRVEQTGSNVTNCSQFFTLRSVTTQQSLSDTDCVTEVGNFRTDFYGIYLDAGETVTIRMNSTQMDAYLILLDANNNLIENDNRASGTTDAEIVYTAPVGRFYPFTATSRQGGEMGAYTLIVQ